MISEATSLANNDLLLVQSQGLTKTVPFNSLNLVKTDRFFNSSIYGSVTGKNSFFSILSANENISSITFYASSFKGISENKKYLTRVTLINGLVTSGVSALNSPEYTIIKNTFIPNLTAFQDKVYKRVVDESHLNNGNQFITIPLNGQTATYTVTGFFNRNPWVDINDITFKHFSFMPKDVTLSAVPFVYNIEKLSETTGENLRFTVNTGYRVRITTPLYWRIFYTKQNY